MKLSELKKILEKIEDDNYKVYVAPYCTCCGRGELDTVNINIDSLEIELRYYDENTR